MLVLFGKSKLFLARLASQDSQARRASEIGWLSDSFFWLVALCEILYSIYFRVNF